jgi:hypothetical protein
MTSKGGGCRSRVLLRGNEGPLLLPLRRKALPQERLQLHGRWLPAVEDRLDERDMGGDGQRSQPPTGP